MNRLLPILAVTAVCAVPAWALQADLPPPTPDWGSTPMVSVSEEKFDLHWLICPGNAGQSGGVIRHPDLLMGDAGVGELGVGVEMVPGVELVPGDRTNPPGGGTPPSGFCHHYELRISSSPITQQNWVTASVVSSNIPASQSGAYTAYEPAYTVTSYTSGGVVYAIEGNTNYYLAVCAYDAAGQVSPVAPLATVVTSATDAVAPGSVTNLTVRSFSHNTITVDFNAACDDLGDMASGPVESYTVRYWEPGGSFATGTLVAPPDPADPQGPSPVQSLTISPVNDNTLITIGICGNDNGGSGAVETVSILTLFEPQSSIGGDSPLSGGCSAGPGSLGLVLLVAAFASLPLLRKPA